MYFIWAHMGGCWWSFQALPSVSVEVGVLKGVMGHSGMVMFPVEPFGVYHGVPYIVPYINCYIHMYIYKYTYRYIYIYKYIYINTINISYQNVYLVWDFPSLACLISRSYIPIMFPLILIPLI